MEKEIQVVQQINDIDGLKIALSGEYQKQIKNFFGNEGKALKFLSSVISAVQRNPALLECTGESVINSFMTMAQLKLMPSDVSGEAYVIPYNNKKKDGNRWIAVKEAQFQLGYQGLVTLFYRAGAKQIIAEIVRKHDKFTYINGIVTHEPDVFGEDRGEAIGAYVIVTLGTGGVVSKVMNKKEITGIAEKFSKSFKSDKSPWHEKNDPQLWMWRKTVLKQAAKLVPKNESLIQAIGEDNKDSVIGDRLAPAKDIAPALTMGAVLKNDKDKEDVENSSSTNEGEKESTPEEIEIEFTSQGNSKEDGNQSA